MRWETLRWLIGAVAVAAIVAGLAAWGPLDASCGTGALSPGQTTSESFDCNGAGYALLASWGLGSLALTALVAIEVIRRLRDSGDEDDPSSDGHRPLT